LNLVLAAADVKLVALEDGMYTRILRKDSATIIGVEEPGDVTANVDED
jgi:phosphopantothenate synthetase